MSLNHTAVYAMRAMTHLALQEPGAYLTASEIAESTCIPEPYVAKVLRRLVVAKLLASKKGRGGGFFLARPAADVPFREVLEAVDALPERDVCAFGWGSCSASHPCPLHEVWSAYLDTLDDWATTRTLADAKVMPGAVRRPCED